MSKQYGLILPNKKAGALTISRPSIFDESDSDSEAPKLTKPTGLTLKPRLQDTQNQKRALEEDPTVYQYDEVYDAMETKKQESKLARKDIEKKPKYIKRLLVAADKRKRENERRVERQVQKEREAEGDEFKDKESFVTSAYKKKLEEMKELEEQEKREDYLESIGDVTKQGNLDGFYRHLYDQKVNYEDKVKKETETKDSEIKKEAKSDGEKSEEETKSRKRRSSNSDKSDGDSKMKKKPGTQNRKYRSRKDVGSADDHDSETEKVVVKKEHLPSNLDADSDFSVDSDSDSEDEAKESKPKEQNGKDNDDKVEYEGEKLQLPAKGNVLSDNAALSKKTEEKEDETTAESNDKETKKENGEEEEKIKEEKPKKPKVDLWKKRTVGEVFDDALMRYYQRKSARGW